MLINLFTDIDYGDLFSKIHNKDQEGAKYKIGDWVRVNHNGNIFSSEITGVSKLEENVYEYSVSSYNFLLWEEEISSEKRSES